MARKSRRKKDVLLTAPKEVVLVSSSPRRGEILQAFYPDLEVVAPRCRELKVKSRLDLELNARAKLESVKMAHSAVGIAADTSIFLSGKALGKPAGEASAKRMLKRLSGKWHAVYTALAVRVDGAIVCELVRTEVRFRKLNGSLIDAYVETGEPLDKAGAYGIQGLGGLLVEEISGDYYNVVGLPLAALEEMLEKHGFTLLSAE